MKTSLTCIAICLAMMSAQTYGFFHHGHGMMFNPYPMQHFQHQPRYRSFPMSSGMHYPRMHQGFYPGPSHRMSHAQPMMFAPPMGHSSPPMPHMQPMAPAQQAPASTTPQRRPMNNVLNMIGTTLRLRSPDPAARFDGLRSVFGLGSR